MHSPITDSMACNGSVRLFIPVKMDTIVCKTGKKCVTL